ncbi:hypothetical protein BV898_15816 [Hypsibius exemplaris]|uniref:Cytochrome b-c1 complex subunit 8 n=1 Tax=Hypsibius exemplaris TaxID=2072580 RepID=A0A9X6NDI4_HYPEX|nr:hypothetical protein BV898_15816 [Hypsibius exemplaris]
MSKIPRRTDGKNTLHVASHFLQTLILFIPLLKIFADLSAPICFIRRISIRAMGGGEIGYGDGKVNKARIPQGHDVWGKMCHYRGVVMHHLSPFEQRVLAGLFSDGIPKMVRRISGQKFKIGLPVLFGALIYNWAETYHKKLIRKDPKFFEDEYKEYLASPEHQTYLANKEAEANAAAKKGK